LHSFGIAVDIDPDHNAQTSGGDPYSGWLKEKHVDAVMNIRVASGKHLWWWGGYWTGVTMCDRMHFQLDVGPSEADNIKWNTVAGWDDGGWEEGDDLPNMSNEAQEYFQAIYESLKKDPDKPNKGDSNPPGATLFSKWASVWRHSVDKTGSSDEAAIVSKFLKDT
jgi:D-alanyl-D-alanine carboxypeptidase